MSNAETILTGYLPILIGILLIVFNKEITVLYEKFAEVGKGSAFSRLITIPRIIIGGMFLIVMGVYKLIESYQ